MRSIDEIKSRLDIVEFIGQRVELRKRGRYYVAPCPFHEERTPSFVVYPESQSWHCFGACSTGGDIFTFVQRQERLDFIGALRALAQKAGVELHERSDAQRQAEARTERLRALVEHAADFYHEKLLTDAGAGRAYAEQRGLLPATMAVFRIGYAPAGWESALCELRTAGWADDDLIDAGLAIRNDAGRVYARFRNRLMIPICDERGRPIGFGARALDPEDNPKYLNSPQTSLFDKSAVIFGLHLARPAIRAQGVAVVVEGYMDAITAHQAGFTNVVAQMGTALTRQQIKLLSGPRRIVLALDSDEAGQQATIRGLHHLAESIREASLHDQEIQVITVPGAKDPDELIRDDPESWQMLVIDAQPVADYLIRHAVMQAGPNASMAERERAAREVLPILTATASDFQRQESAQRLAYALRLGTGLTMLRYLETQTANGAKPATAGSSVVGPTGPGTLEQLALAAMLREDTSLALSRRAIRELAQMTPKGSPALSPIGPEDFTDASCRAIFGALCRAHEQCDLDWPDWMSQHLPDDLAQQFAALRAPSGDVEKARPRDDLAIFELRRLRLKRENADLQFLIAESDDPIYLQRLSANKAALAVLETRIRSLL